MERALITGVTGQDGAYLSRFLLEKGYAVHGLVTEYDRSHLNNLRLLGVLDRIELIQGDLMDLRGLTDLLTGLRPQEVYHLAAQSSVAQSFVSPVDTVSFNIQSTHHLLEALRILELPVRFYQASSSEILRQGRGLAARGGELCHPSCEPLCHLEGSRSLAGRQLPGGLWDVLLLRPSL